jgi:putative ABC transport system permease protein
MTDIIASFINLIPVTVAQSLIIAFVVVGIMLPFRILNFPDLTSEGAYPLGGCVAGAMISSGFDPVAAMLVAACCGFLAGCSTALIHLRFGINTLLAGILVLTMLYSIDIRIMGRSNIALFTFPSLLKNLGGAHANEAWFKIVLVGALLAVVIAALYYFFITEKGAAMRAVGASPDMAEAQGISIWKATILGVGAASALTAFGGSLMVQTQGFADVNMGFGILINGLAALIIGEAFIGRRTVARQLLAPIVGAIAFYQLLSICLSLGLAPVDLKLATGIFVLVMLGIPGLRRTTGGMLARERMRE